VKRLLLALVGFWVVLGAVLVLLVALSDAPEGTAPKPPGPLTCASLQRRAEQCADDLSALAADLVIRHTGTPGGASFGSEAKRAVVATLVQTAIAEKKVAAYCRRYWNSPRPLVRRARAALQTCFGRPGCKPFSACLRDLAARLDLGALLTR
jgi:hypothetical protein